MRVLIADLIGLVLVFGVLSVGVVGLRSSDVPGILWVVAYLVVGVIAVGIWHSEKWPAAVKTCLMLAAGSVVMGAISYAVDTLVVLFVHPEGSIWSLGTKARGPFGFFITVGLCPGLTTFALGGALRAMFLLQPTNRSTRTD
jgi:hypothetical protein